LKIPIDRDFLFFIHFTKYHENRILIRVLYKEQIRKSDKVDNKKVLGKSLNKLFKENRIDDIKGFSLKIVKQEDNKNKIKTKVNGIN